MNIKVFTLSISLFLLAACSSDTDNNANSDITADSPEQVSATAESDIETLASTQLAELVDEYFERYLALNPLRATRIGDDRYNDRYANNLGSEHRAETTALNNEFLARLLELDAGELEAQDVLTYGTFKLSREMELEADQYPSYLQPISQRASFVTTFVQLGGGANLHPFKTVKDYDDFLGRIDDFLVLLDQAIANMKLGMEQGVVQPRILMEQAQRQLGSQIVSSAEESTFYAPIKNMPEEFGDADSDRLEAAYRQAIENKIIPAYEKLHNFVRDEYMEGARESVGLNALPNGEAWYAYRVRLITTTDLNPGQIHQIGLDEVSRIQGEMQAVMQEVNFEGDLQAFFEYLNTTDQFYYDEPEQLIQGYQGLSDHITSLTPKLFNVFPKAGFEVRRVEAFRERSAGGASYTAGTPDGLRPGVFYANTYNIKARPIWTMESLFLHEAIPGHHFQRSLQQEVEDMPRFRRFGGYSVYSEGWGLYAESLGKELGVYADPYQYFGMLNGELWRAIRLVSDTGLHAKSWNRQDALDYMYANSAVSEARALSEVDRHIATPGAVLAYKIGQLKIQELRTRAEESLGNNFDIRAFHTAVLIDGPLPLNLLDAKINRWIDMQ